MYNNSYNVKVLFYIDEKIIRLMSNAKQDHNSFHGTCINLPKAGFLMYLPKLVSKYVSVVNIISIPGIPETVHPKVLKDSQSRVYKEKYFVIFKMKTSEELWYDIYHCLLPQNIPQQYTKLYVKLFSCM